MKNSLKKTSTENEIKIYFQKILELKQANDDFPVDLDEVWPLVYAAKNKAVNELLHSKNDNGTSRYIEGVDYQALNQKVQAGTGTSKKINYKLSVPCLEWFIARKVRPVFEVYRQIFHKVAEKKGISVEEHIITQRGLVSELFSMVNGLQREVDELKLISNKTKNHFTIGGYTSLRGIYLESDQAKMFGVLATELCEARGLPTNFIPDSRYGKLKTYPLSVLDDIIEDGYLTDCSIYGK